MLAVLAADGAYCPLDITAPDARTAAMVRRLGCRVAVADRTRAGRRPAGVTAVDPVGPPETFHATPVNQDALAYVMHTSGPPAFPRASG